VCFVCEFLFIGRRRRLTGASVHPASLAEAATKTPSKKKTYTCANCRNEGASLRCTVCKKVAYCNRNCQVRVLVHGL